MMCEDEPYCRTFTVAFSMAGAPANVIEECIVNPLEQALFSLDNVKSITAFAFAGSGKVGVHLYPFADASKAFAEVGAAVAASNLPPAARIWLTEHSNCRPMS